MIIDSHSHAWRMWPYDKNVPDPSSRGSAEALLYEMDTHQVDRAVVVCARIGAGAAGEGFANDDNNAYVAKFAQAHPDRLTPWVDVDCFWRDEYHQPGATQRLIRELDQWQALGFTHYLGGENDGWLRSDEGREFFRVAAEAGVIASLSLGSPDWIGDIVSVARDNPSLPVVLHHLGVPRGAALEKLLVCAAVPSIGVKISGFHYRSRQAWDFPFNDAVADFREIHRAFGPERLYWGSDFPAGRDSVTYVQTLEVVRTHSDFLTASDLRLILGENLDKLLRFRTVPARDNGEQVGDTAHSA